MVPRDEIFAALWPGRRVEDNNLTQAGPGLVALGVDRLLDPLRNEPQFECLVQQLGM